MSLYAQAAAAAILSGQYDDGLIERYNIAVGASPNHVQHHTTGTIGRTGVRFETGSAGLTKVVKSVWIRFRKYGNPTGTITCNIRKAADDSAVLIRTFPINSNQFAPGTGEAELVLRNRNNTYQMVANDIVSIEYPVNATDGFEITTNSSASDPSGYTSRSHNGTAWSTTLSDPLAIIVKTD